MSKYEYPAIAKEYCYPDHNPRWNRTLPTRPGFIGAGLVVGALATFALQKVFIDPCKYFCFFLALVTPT